MAILIVFIWFSVISAASGGVSQHAPVKRAIPAHPGFFVMIQPPLMRFNGVRSAATRVGSDAGRTGDIYSAGGNPESAGCWDRRGSKPKCQRGSGKHGNIRRSRQRPSKGWNFLGFQRRTCFIWKPIGGFSFGACWSSEASN